MKFNLIDEIRNIIEQSKTWVMLELEYAKLTVTEKLTMLLTTLILGFVCLMLGIVVLMILALALAHTFMMIMSPSLSYVCTAGVVIVLLVLIFLLRRPLLITPIARIISKIFYNKQ